MSKFDSSRQCMSGVFDSGTMFEVPGMPPVYSSPSMLSLPANNQLGGNLTTWPYARAGGSGANVGAAYKVPNRAASMHYDPDVNRTDYKRLQISTTIQNAWATNRGSVANGQAFYQPNTPDTTIQPVQVQGISYAPSGYAQAAQPFYSNPYTPASSSYQQPAAQYANIEDTADMTKIQGT